MSSLSQATTLVDLIAATSRKKDEEMDRISLTSEEKKKQEDLDVDLDSSATTKHYVNVTTIKPRCYLSATMLVVLDGIFFYIVHYCSPCMLSMIMVLNKKKNVKVKKIGKHLRCLFTWTFFQNNNNK